MNENAEGTGCAGELRQRDANAERRDRKFVKENVNGRYVNGIGRLRLPDALAASESFTFGSKNWRIP